MATLRDILRAESHGSGDRDVSSGRRPDRASPEGRPCPDLAPANVVLAVDLQFEAELARADHGLSFLGPTVRGAFGIALKDVVCRVPHRQCSRCLIAQACPYPAIFEGQAPAGSPRGWQATAIPQPFVLTVAPPGPDAAPVTRLVFGIYLIGTATHWAPYVVQAVEAMGRHGLGRRRVPFQVAAVRDGMTGTVLWQAGSQVLAPVVASPMTRRERPPAGPVRWKFVTPICMRAGSADIQEPTGLDLVVAGRRRWSLLQRFHAGADALTTDVRFSPDEFKTVDRQVEPWKIDRFSTRQKRSVRLSGVLGEMTIDGPWDRVGDWMRVVESTHLGKYASFGFGRVSWQSV